MEGIPYYLTEEVIASGAILVKVIKTKDEVNLFHNRFDHTGNSSWVLLSEGNEKKLTGVR